MKRAYVLGLATLSLALAVPVMAKTVTITFGTTKGPDELKVYQRLITEFEQLNPGIKVKMNVYSSDFREKLLLQFSIGNAPDAFETGLEDFPLYPKSGYLYPLDKFADNNDLKDYPKQLIKTFSYKGHLYAMTRDVAPLVMIYNKRLFSAAGINPPDDSWTWDSYTTVLKKMTIDTNGDGKPDRYGFAGSPWANFVWQAGGDIFDDEIAPKKLTLGTPEALAGLQFAVDLVNKYQVSPVANWNDVGRFAQGKAATVISGYWERIYSLKTMKDPWDAAAVPAGKVRTTTMYTAAYSVNKVSKHPQEAYKWVEFICSPKAQREMAKMGVAVPSRTSVAKEVIPNNPPPANGLAFLKGVEYGRLAYQFGFRNPWAEVEAGLNELWSNKGTPRQVVSKMESKINGMLARIR